MASKLSILRLQKEYKALLKSPVENIDAVPMFDNILEWHYVLQGPKGSPFEGGFYHGKLVFPPEYPYKAPSIFMLTPNGRFCPNTRLCFSMSDFHPETWNPLWSVSSILSGLLSFMLENELTYGSMQSTIEDKVRYAKMSLRFNVKVPIFAQLFPKYVDLFKQMQAEQNSSRIEDKQSNTGMLDSIQHRMQEWSISLPFVLIVLQSCLLIIFLLKSYPDKQ
jgi:ubiquitin-conjugating enzyme E2 J2